MSPEEGARLLLCRIGKLTSAKPLDSVDPRDLEAAINLAQRMGGLTLAIENACSYIN
jgi:hypothetical protein